MNIENAKKWVQALRSGRYKQLVGSLRDDIGEHFCCLGVAHECLVGPLHNDRQERYSAVRRALGIDTSMTDKLWMMNDRDRKSFAEIADYVDAIIADSERTSCAVTEPK